MSKAMQRKVSKAIWLFFSIVFITVFMIWIKWYNPYAKLIVVNGSLETKTLQINNEDASIQPSSYTFITIYESVPIKFGATDVPSLKEGKYIVSIDDYRKVAYMQSKNLYKPSIEMRSTGIPGVKAPYHPHGIDATIENSINSVLASGNEKKKKDKIVYILEPSGSGIYYIGSTVDAQDGDYFTSHDSYTEEGILIEDEIKLRSGQIACESLGHLEVILEKKEHDPLNQIGINMYCGHFDSDRSFSVYISSYSASERHPGRIAEIAISNDRGLGSVYIEILDKKHFPEKLVFIEDQRGFFDFLHQTLSKLKFPSV